MIFQNASRFYVDFDFYIDSVVNCKHDGTMYPAHQTQDSMRRWAKRITESMKRDATGRTEQDGRTEEDSSGCVLTFDHDVQPRHVAHMLNEAMAKDPFLEYDMGINRVPYARLYVLRDRLCEPEFGDPYVNTSLGWDCRDSNDIIAELEARAQSLQVQLAESKKRKRNRFKLTKPARRAAARTATAQF